MNLITDEPGKDVAQNNILKLWYHHDHLGTTDYLTDNVDGKVVSYVTYGDWGATTAKANLKMGVRELDLVLEYTGHPYDQVMGLYFAEARMYDASARRFVSVDPVKGFMRSTQSLNQYLYVLDNPLKYVDLRDYTISSKSTSRMRIQYQDPDLKVLRNQITVSMNILL